ncbi:hypothetical protein MP228_007240 [Amoeboaphelidium protococcarum]|nr:hypothetical protein MP228_007240 [Amoeboaphelidium protococcarum]
MNIHINNLVLKSSHPVEFFEDNANELYLNEDLYVCNKCGLYFPRAEWFQLHHCTQADWPTSNNRNLVYQHGQEYRIYRVSPSDYKLYCQCLCLLGKSFMKEKTTFFYLEGFDFYVTYSMKDKSLLGFFSKELDSVGGWNLACIVVLPPYQKTGIGKLMIDLSYWVSRAEQKIGSPERPLSSLGRLSYTSYWISLIVPYMLSILSQSGDSYDAGAGQRGKSTRRQAQTQLTVAELSAALYIQPDDILLALSQYGLVQHATLQKDVVVTWEMLHQVAVKQQDKWRLQLRIEPSKVKWNNIPSIVEFDTLDTQWQHLLELPVTFDL